ncbi:phage tail tip lysozyme [Aureimonas sp. AU12]|uniref:phage tail tip lysozyme n=1 Tax=Aureimonas sp. AU12 TaxID=1638161 RepID=UPI0007856E97|nr:phage tail tip lysozyme [Aureimonas sp. AU12]
MANKRPSEVTYRPLRVDPIIQDGLLRVDRPDGGPERRVAEAFGRLAYQADQVADDFAQEEGRRAGERNALANGPRPSEISGGVSSTYEPGSMEPMAYSGGGGESQRVASGGGDLETRGKYIYDGLRQRGLSHVAAAAGVGHARQESSLNAAGPDGDKGTSSGLFQWRNERRTALQNFARAPRYAEQGKSWRDTDVQLDFFVDELKTKEKLAWNRLQAATDITSATEALMHFERPQHYTARAPRRGHGWDNRLANARWASAFGSDSAPAPSAIAANPAPGPAPAATALSATPAATGAAAAIETIAPRDGTAPAPASTAAAVAPASTAPAIPPESVGPPSVTRVVEPMTARGGGGGFRPTGSMTIRGRAYDAAGTRTYLEQLDNTIRADTDEVYRKFKDDPAALDNAFGALRTVHMQDHVFPEVAADYDRTFSSVTRAYRTQARDDADRRVLQQDRADFLTRSQEMETMTARSVEAFDPSNADAGAAVASAQAASDAHFDSAVARGILDPDDAVRAKIASRRNTAVGFYGRQASALTSPEEVTALKEKMRADFAAGGLDGLDGDGWAQLEATFDRTANEKQRVAQEAGRSLKARGDAMAESVARGFEVDAGEMGRFLLDRRTATDGPQIVDRTIEKIGAARILRDKPLSAAETYVRGLERDPAAVSSGTADFARAELERMQTAAKTDPIGLAERKGLLPPEEGTIVEAASPEDLAARIQQRTMRAEAAAEHFGVTPKYLKPEEVAAIRGLVDQDPARAAQLAAGIVGGGGAKAGQILAELKEDAPAIEQAGVILAGGGSDRAARDVIVGYGIGADGKKLPEVMKDTQRAEIARSTFGAAFAGSPADATRTIAAAEAMTRARVAQSGLDPKSDAVRPIFEQALQEAAGARFEAGVQYGGLVTVPVGGVWGFGADRPTVVVPPTIRADCFADVVDALRDTDLVPIEEQRSRAGVRYFSAPPVRENGKPYSAADVKAATPVAVAGGYRFAFGDPSSEDPQWIRGADGKPFLIAFDAMKPILEARVPGAYR